jgi:hypothetical protein
MRSRRYWPLVVLATLAGLLPGVPAHAATPTTWPQFMFNARHTGFNNVENTVTRANVTNLSLEYIATGPGQSEGGMIAQSAPAVVGNVAYVGTVSGLLLALPATGCGDSLCQPLWTAQLSNGVFSSPAVSNGVVYVASAGTEDGLLYAFNAAGCGRPTCGPLWTAVDHGNIGSSPTVSGGFVYLTSFAGQLQVFRAAGCGVRQCQPVWTAQIGSSTASPAVANGVVYAAGSDRLFAFNAAGCGAATCNPLWRSTLNTGQFLGSGPAVDNGTVYVGTMDTSNSTGKLLAFTASGCGTATCRPLWSGTAAGISTTPAVANGTVYVGAGDGFLYVFKGSGCGRATCAPLWRGFPINGVVAATDASPAVAGGVVYFAQNNARVGAFDARGCGQALCDALWFFITDDSIVNSPVIVNGRLYVAGSNFGSVPEMWVFKPV